MSSAEFAIDGMHCDGCAARIERLLTQKSGVRAAAVSYADGRATVRFNPAVIAPDGLRAVIEQAGFSVRES